VQLLDAREVGRLLKELRQRRNLNQKEAADLAHISISLLSRVEHGNRIPSLWTVLSLVHVYDFELHILDREEIDAPIRPAETHRE
jgi:transcriptional regulator with XRE-family HTH domain